MDTAAVAAARHTILLAIHTTIGSRTYLDNPSPTAFDNICNLYETSLKAANPKATSISYDISDLYTFLDNFVDISILVYHEPVHGYLPRDRVDQEAAVHAPERADLRGGLTHVELRRPVAAWVWGTCTARV